MKLEVVSESLKRLVTEVPISEWPPSLLLAFILYLIGFGGACAFSVIVERHEPHRGATIFHLIYVTLLMAVFWPIWVFPMVAFALVVKLFR